MLPDSLRPKLIMSVWLCPCRLWCFPHSKGPLRKTSMSAPLCDVFRFTSCPEGSHKKHHGFWGGTHDWCACQKPWKNGAPGNLYILISIYFGDCNLCVNDTAGAKAPPTLTLPGWSVRKHGCIFNPSLTQMPLGLTFLHPYSLSFSSLKLVVGHNYLQRLFSYLLDKYWYANKLPRISCASCPPKVDVSANPWCASAS